MGNAMTDTAETPQELQPHEFMARLSPRLRIHYNKETGRHTASFAGVFEKLDGDVKKALLGIGKTEMEACRALAMRMRELYQLGRLQVLDENATTAGPETIVSNDFSCNTRRV